MDTTLAKSARAARAVSYARNDAAGAALRKALLELVPSEEDRARLEYMAYALAREEVASFTSDMMVEASERAGLTKEDIIR